MNKWEIILGVVFGLIVNEITDVSPWVARKLVRRAAYWWTTDSDLAARYAEEWTAIIEERPGKLLKVLSSLAFAGGAVRRGVPRWLGRVWRRRQTRRREWGYRHLAIVRVSTKYGVVEVAKPVSSRVLIIGIFNQGRMLRAAHWELEGLTRQVSEDYSLIVTGIEGRIERRRSRW